MSTVGISPADAPIQDDAETGPHAFDPKPWKFALAVVLGVRLAFFAVAYAARWFLSEDRGRLDIGFLDVWSQWDASSHFFVIARDGYAADPHGTAFFPLFPLLLRAGSLLGLPLVVTGLLVSAISSVVAFAYLYKLAESEMGAGGGRRAVLYLALFPTAVFLVAPYSEALFLAGAIPAFYYARRRQWHRVGIPAAVATGARFAGVFLLLGLAVEWMRQKDFSVDRVLNAALSLGVALLPPIAYMAYLAQTRGDPLYFVTDQRLGWYRELTNPVEAFRATYDTWYGSYQANWIFAWRMEIVAAAAGVLVTALALARREWGYATYMGSAMAVMLSSTWYFSIPRILLSFFPAALFLAAATLRRPERHELALVVLAPIAALGVVVYTHGAWFY